MATETIGSLTVKNRDLLMALMNLIEAGELAQTYLQDEKYQPDLYDGEDWRLLEQVDDSLSQAIIEAQKVIEAERKSK